MQDKVGRAAVTDNRLIAFFRAGLMTTKSRAQASEGISYKQPAFSIRAFFCHNRAVLGNKRVAEKGELTA